MIKQVASIIRKRWYCLPSKSNTDQIRIKQQPDNQQVDGGFNGGPNTYVFVLLQENM